MGVNTLNRGQRRYMATRPHHHLEPTPLYIRMATISSTRSGNGLHARVWRQSRYSDVRLRQTEIILGLVALSGS